MTAPAPARTRTMTPHEMCEELLTRHSIATSQSDGDEMRSVALRNPAGSYFLLRQNTTPGDRTCRLHTWNGGMPAATITPDDDSRVIPAGAVSVLRHAIPIPAGGTLLGWVGPGQRITALIPVYADYRLPGSPEPSWAVLPHRHAPETAWPPFINGNLFCPQMWDAVQAGQLVSLGPVIATREDTVFWIEAREADAPGYCDVDTDVRWDGYTLPAGQYADYDDLRRGMEWPNPLELIVDYTSHDLAPRFCD